MPGTAAPNTVLPGVRADAGEMASLILDHDWSATPLGPVEQWPQSLRTIVGAMLNTRYAMFLFWGDEATCVYNDAYRPSLGADMHPAALGSPGARVWTDIWHIIGPQIESVMRDGANTWFENQLVPFDRNGYFEEIYFTYSYSPVYGESGTVGGTLVVCSETTEQVLSERRLGLLQRLAAVSEPSEPVGADSDDQVRAVVDELLRVLAGDPADVPWALLYRHDRDAGALRRVATVGLDVAASARVAPGRIGLDAPGRAGVDGDASPWAEVLGALARTGSTVEVRDLRARFGPLPGGAWPEAPAEAVAVPLPLGDDPVGYVLVLALSARKRLDAAYRQFVDLVAAQFTAAVARAWRRQQERDRLDRLAELDRAKTAFLSTVSHELRTPLALVLAPLETVLAAQDAPQPELLLAHRNATRLLKLVDALLDFSRIESARMEFTPVATDLAALTGDCVAAFESAAAVAGVDLVLRCGVPVVAAVDRAMWEKVVLNLVSNALKYTERGTVAVRVATVGDEAVLEVADTGIGIDPAELPHVFERFFRSGDERARSIEGTGIGLALVREMAAMHGGSVEAASVPGSGSTFTVRVAAAGATAPTGTPAAADTAGDTGARAAFVAEAEHWNTDAATTTDVPAAGYVLVVDDNADMRRFLAATLAEIAPVVTAAGGREALAIAARRAPDVVVSDVMMPAVGGTALAVALRDDPELADVPLILLSARADHDSIVAGLDAGATDYLAKPFSAAELVCRVRTHLDAVRLRRQRAHDAEQARLREERHALELNDRVLQSLITARLALELDPDRVAPALDSATAGVRDLIRRLLAASADDDGRPQLLRPAAVPVRTGGPA